MTDRIILFINTSDRDKTTITLSLNEKPIGQKSEARVAASQAALPLIDALLKELHISFTDISEIRINAGPGSFTGLRVGASVANALGWLLDIPVNGKRNVPVEPVYENSRW